MTADTLFKGAAHEFLLRLFFTSPDNFPAQEDRLAELFKMFYEKGAADKSCHTKSEGDYKKTSRGFLVFGKVEDTYGNEVAVQESSYAEEYCCFIFTRDPLAREPNRSSPHLSVEQAKEVRDALNAFIESATWRFEQNKNGDVK